MSEHDFENLLLHPVAYVHTDFPEKFGIPRQGAVVKNLKGTLELTEAFRKPGIFKGLEQYSHLWLIWGFSANTSAEWSPTVRPPRLGGNARMGVFATRSPFRPNPLGLTAVRIEAIHEDIYRIDIAGTDFKDGTPVYDIKPYIPYGDAIPEAASGFTAAPLPHLKTVFPEAVREKFPKEKYETLREILAADPRPAYQRDPDRIYGLSYAGFDVHFQVKENTVIVLDAVERSVSSVQKADQ
jgi:tRNA-Thr(GGU) m(6)t(6)A37 methyltransferase TsaA